MVHNLLTLHQRYIEILSTFYGIVNRKSIFRILAHSPSVLYIFLVRQHAFCYTKTYKEMSDEEKAGNQQYLSENKAYRLRFARAERGRTTAYFLSCEYASLGAICITGNAKQFPIIQKQEPQLHKSMRLCVSISAVRTDSSLLICQIYASAPDGMYNVLPYDFRGWNLRRYLL